MWGLFLRFFRGILVVLCREFVGTWREMMDFLKDFSNVYISEDFAEQKRLKDTQSNEKSNISVTKITPPNNDKLIEYFNNRGIDKDILEKYTKQIHYKVEDKSYFGLGNFGKNYIVLIFNESKLFNALIYPCSKNFSYLQTYVILSLK